VLQPVHRGRRGEKWAEPTKEERAVDDRELMRALIIEFIGPFALVFMGVGAIILTAGQDNVAIAFAHGLAIGLMAMAAGHISGGHFNPAVTIAMLVTRRIDTQRAVAYIIAQLAGGLAGAGVLVLCFRDIERNAVNLGVPAIGANNSALNALVMEIVLTFFLVLVIFGTAVDTRTPKAVSGLVIGLTITMDILAGVGVSGAAMNPARWFGPAVVQQDWSDLWIWWVGPIVGGVIAAVLYNDVILSAIGREAPTRARVVDEGEGVQAAAVRETPAPVARSRRARRRGR
jgi:aquaporin TIP